MASNKDEEPEHAMEEGNAAAAADTPAAAKVANNNSNKTKIMAAVGAAVLVAVILAIALPLGLRNKDETSIDNASNLSPDLNNLSGSSSRRSRSLPVVSIDTLKETYTTCVDLTSDLEVAARMMANQTIESDIQYYFYRPDNVYFRGEEGPPLMFATTEDFAAPVSAPLRESSADSSTVSAGGGVGNIATSETSFESNNQEEGVEEPDVVKSDGVSVYAAYGTEIVKISVQDTAVESRTQLPVEEGKCNLNYISNMLLVDDTLITISSGWCYEEHVPAEPIIPVATTRSSFIDPYYYGGQSITRILMFDKNTMELKGSPRDMKGSYNFARAIRDDVYVITSKSINMPPFYDWFNIWDTAALGKNFTEDDYREYAAAKLDEHMSSYVSSLVDSFDDCGSIQRLALFQNEEATDTLPSYQRVMESISTVTGFNINTPNLFSAKSLILPHSGWQVYSSDTQLVLAAQGWWFIDGASQETYVITYRLDNAQASVVGFGSVPGYVLNQYSIDHQSKNGKDYLLLATTIRERWAMTLDEVTQDTVFRPIADTTSQITVLEVPSEETLTETMAVVGKVEGLGKPGEEIYSVRFQENRAFVVTFERTDPFYTIDVTDPENPQKVGELEIPGFSSYLHPIGEHLILAVGQYVDENTGRQEGLQISIFDVEDFANPQQIHTYTEDSGDSSGSAAEYDPMAFRYLDDTGLLILPVSVYDWNRSPADDATPFNGFKVYKADEEGIIEYLSVNHETRDYYFYRHCWRVAQGSLAGRSLVFSGVLWTMQGNAIQFSDLSTRVTSSEPIDLDADNENAIECYDPFEEPVDFEIPPLQVNPDCSAVSCVVPECEDDSELFTPEGECCSQCAGVPVPVEISPCFLTICSVPDCGDDTPFTPEGQCCPQCPGENEMPECAAVSCLLPDCGDDEPFTPDGQCCPRCPDVVIPVELPPCATVRCAIPDCGDDEPFTPEGECCARCPGVPIAGLVATPPVVPPECALVDCATPDCGGNTPFTPEGECCPVCPEEPDCSTVDCAEPDCGEGTPFTLEGECCPVCTSTTRPSYCTVSCVGLVCRPGETKAYVDGDCCPSCLA